MSREDDVARLYQCARKYEIIVKQGTKATKNSKISFAIIYLERQCCYIYSHTNATKHRRRTSADHNKIFA
ncbi:hypothetical protein MRB53_004170 [Persea americana]|uniref:Uncharacterized protein n=1 Tax=Persea americana TaxID=3435 RepID=A0ACC2MZB0_PERAE|nr:hypothetical protein MRB53_004170 [Persea americana]